MDTDLTTLEQNLPELKGKIKDNKFTFDKSTTEYKMVYLGNLSDKKGDENKWDARATAKDFNSFPAGLEEEVALTGMEFVSEQPNLKYLNINFCGLTKLTIKNCPNLETLYVVQNQLEEIKFEGTFENLKLIDLTGNRLTKIELSVENAPNLRYLYLAKNQLKDLSGLAGFFTRGKDDFLDFSFGGNEELQSPPLEYIMEGKEKTIEWFRQAEKYKTEKAYEAKILLVGEPKAGKTTLMNLLFNKKFKVPQPEDKQPSTLGVEVKSNRPFANPDPNLPDINAHIWDFGGQDIQYMLHQYFLTDDSVYILITDGRSGKTRYGYWFHIINLLGKNSPILVLLNRHEKSDTVIPFDEAKYTDIFSNLKIQNCGEIDFGHLDKRWDALEEIIAKKLAELPVVGKTIIKPWKIVREKIEAKRNKKYIPLSDFEDICDKAGLKEPSEKEDLLDYFHKIGFVLNFEDENLSHTVFLDANWITHAIYDVLSDKNDDKVIDVNGEFEKDKLYTHWQSKKLTQTHTQPYSKAECGYLLNLMKKDKFDICYELRHKPGFYVVPMKLPDVKSTYSLGNNKKLHFRFQYSFMPEGLISRLIVRLHDKILDGKVWLSGGYFFDNGCVAEVIQHETTKQGLKYIGIKVAGDIGEKRRAFLRNIRKEVEYIHKNTFPYISYSEMIVCNCEFCENEKNKDPNYYELDEINSHIEADEETIFCKEGKQRVPISNLLHEVFTDEEIEKYDRKSLYRQKAKTHPHTTYIKTLIAKGKTERAIEELLAGTEASGQENLKGRIVIVSGNYSSAKEDRQKDVISYNEFTQAKAKANNALNNYLNEYVPKPDFEFDAISDEEFEEEEKVTPTEQQKNVWKKTGKILAIIAAIIAFLAAVAEFSGFSLRDLLGW